MVPFGGVIDAISLEGNIGVIGVSTCGIVDVVSWVACILWADIGSGGVFRAGVDVDFWSGGVPLGAEDEVPVFINAIF